MTEAFVGATYVAVLIALAIVLLKLSDITSSWIRRIRNPRHVLAAQHEQFERRLQRPDWPFYEQHLQRPVPSDIRALYKISRLNVPAFRFASIHVTLAPIDAQALSENWVLPGVVPFAESDGDPIYLKAGALSSNAVYITYHDGNDTEQLAPSIESFVAGLRAVT